MACWKTTSEWPKMLLDNFGTHSQLILQYAFSIFINNINNTIVKSCHHVFSCQLLPKFGTFCQSLPTVGKIGGNLWRFVNIWQLLPTCFSPPAELFETTCGCFYMRKHLQHLPSRPNLTVRSVRHEIEKRLRAV